MSGKVPKIRVSNRQIPDIATDAWDALRQADGDAPEIFNFGGAIARVERGTVRALRKEDLIFHLAESAQWFKMSPTRKLTAVAPPENVAQHLLSTPEDRIMMPPLRRVASTPLILPDGSIITERGYDQATGIFLATGSLTLDQIPDEPSAEDAATALGYINDELLHDFPFAGAADRANCLGFYLTLFARELIDGPVPMFFIEKPSPGTGGSLIVETFATVCARPVGTGGLVESEAEWRKQITSALLESPEILWLDNLDGTLASSSLARLLTARIWSDRMLGVNKTVHLPVSCAVVGTGNQPTVSVELSRRIVDVRLDAKMEKPWERTGFRNPRLVAWAREHRGTLTAAALTVLRAWIVAGSPAGPHRALGSFERWSDVIGGALHYAGIEGFLGNAARFFEKAVPESEVRRELILRWWERHSTAPVLTKQVLELVDGAGGEDDDPIAVKLGGGDSHRARSTALGMLLGNTLRDLRFTFETDELASLTLSIVEAGSRGRAALWKLVEHERAPRQPTLGVGGRTFEPSEPF